MNANLNIAPKFVPAQFEEFDQRVSENVSATQHIWLCVRFPELVLHVFERVEGMSFAIIEQQKNRHVIFAACAIAQSQGITPGMPLNAAYALCRNLIVRVRDFQLEQKKLEQLARQAACFTPNIALESPEAVLMEVSGSLKLFGGMEKLQTRLRKAFSKHEQFFLMAAAPTPTAAWLLVHNDMEEIVTDKASLKSVLGGIALVDAGLSLKLIDGLSKSGLTCLRDLWRLPRDGLARRFGTPLLAFLDRACGMQADLRRVFIPGVRFQAELELPMHSDDAGLLLIAMQKLLNQVEEFLRHHDAMADTLLVELWHDRTSHTLLPIRLQKAGRQTERFLALIKERLEHTSLQDLVERIALRIDRILPYAESHTDLFDKRDADEQDWQQLMEIIKARVGDAKVHGVQPVSDHRPEHAWQYRPPEQAHDNTSAQSWMQTLQRPISLFLQARPIAMDPLTLITAAERVESGWWDDDDIRRDYYVAVSEKGARWWVYQDMKNGKRWYLHGLFA